MTARRGHMNGHDRSAPPPPNRSRPTASPKSAPKPRAPKVDPDAARRIFAAQVGRREAEAEWAQALVAGVAAGVIPDTAAAPEPVGTNRIVYADAGLQIVLQVAAPIAGLNVAAFVADLVQAGVAPRLINRLAAKHGTETRPAHKFVCTALG